MAAATSRKKQTAKKRAPAGKRSSGARARTSKTKKKRTTKKKRPAVAAAQDDVVVVEEAQSTAAALYDDSMTAKRNAFAHEILIDNNATKAAIRAGFDPKTAASTASQLLRDPKVAALVQRLRDARAERTGITADRVLLELARVALVDVRELFVWDEARMAFVPSRDLSADQAAAIQAVKTRSYTTYYKNGNVETRHILELKVYDKVAALREAGKHLGVEQKLALSLHDPNANLSTQELRIKNEELLKAVKKRLKKDA